MNKVCIKKVCLLALIIVFFCIYIVQLVSEGKTETRTVTLSSFDSIEISWKDGAEDINLKLIKKDGKYFTEKNNYEVSASSAEDMENAVKSINVLGTLASSVKDNEERYGLSEANAVTVKVYKGSKLVRSILVGKDSSTNTRSFVCLDDKKEVVTVQGALHSIFAVTEDSVRTKEVYSADSNLITKVYVKTAEEEYELSKVLNSTDTSKVWDLTLNNTSIKDAAPDAAKIKAWLNLVSSLEADKWQAKDTALYSDKADVEFTLTAGVKTYSVKLYKGAEENSDLQVVCSESPYSFTVPSYYLSRFGKVLKDIIEESSAE